MQNNRGYAPELDWLRYNRKVAFHMVTRSSRHHLFRYSDRLHDPSLFLLWYMWMQHRDVINQQQSQLLKCDYASQANELALVTNVLGYVSMLSNKALFLGKHFSSTIPGCFGILLIKHIFLN